MTPTDNTANAENLFEQGLLKYFTADQLHSIQSQKIGIGGAGGLGSNVAMILVRSGFKRLEILDHDVVDASNLNRQQYFYNEIGQAKVRITQQRLLDINPDLELFIHQVKWTPETAEHYFQNCDIIMEAFDVAESKFQFVQAYQNQAKFVVSGNGMAGLSIKQPMTVRKLGNIYVVGDGSTDAAEGHPPLAPRVTACAAKMAEIVLDLTLGLQG